MTTDYDNEVNKLVLKTAFGDNKKCEVYDRRFNDDADLK
jgi:hypothetical protein